MSKDKSKSMAETIKDRGLPSVKYVCEQSGTKRATLRNWFRNKPLLFNLVMDACLLNWQAERKVEALMKGVANEQKT